MGNHPTELYITGVLILQLGIQMLSPTLMLQVLRTLWPWLLRGFFCLSSCMCGTPYTSFKINLKQSFGKLLSIPLHRLLTLNSSGSEAIVPLFSLPLRSSRSSHPAGAANSHSKLESGSAGSAGKAQCCLDEGSTKAPSPVLCWLFEWGSIHSYTCGFPGGPS